MKDESVTGEVEVLECVSQPSSLCVLTPEAQGRKGKKRAEVL
jgi:hypothetical protein